MDGCWMADAKPGEWAETLRMSWLGRDGAGTEGVQQVFRNGRSTTVHWMFERHGDWVERREGGEKEKWEAGHPLLGKPEYFDLAPAEVAYFKIGEREYLEVLKEGNHLLIQRVTIQPDGLNEEPSLVYFSGGGLNPSAC